MVEIPVCERKRQPFGPSAQACRFSTDAGGRTAFVTGRSAPIGSLTRKHRHELFFDAKLTKSTLVSGNVVGHTMERNLPIIRVDQGVGGPRPPVARLADRPWIQYPTPPRLAQHRMMGMAKNQCHARIELAIVQRRIRIDVPHLVIEIGVPEHEPPATPRS